MYNSAICKEFIVYSHTVPNGKKYIGITSQNPQVRWGKQGQGYKGQIFYRAIEKYGWDSIVHEIIYSGLTYEEAAEKETLLIEQYRTQDKDYGYNMDGGGFANFPSEESKIKMKEAARIRSQSVEYLDKQSQAQKQSWLDSEIRQKRIDGAKKAHNTDKAKQAHSNASKKQWSDVGYREKMHEKLSQGAKKRFASEEQRRHMGEISKLGKHGSKVICDDIVYDSITECAKFLGCNRNTLSDYLCGRRPFPKKYGEHTIKYLT